MWKRIFGTTRNRAHLHGICPRARHPTFFTSHSYPLKIPTFCKKTPNAATNTRSHARANIQAKCTPSPPIPKSLSKETKSAPSGSLSLSLEFRSLSRALTNPGLINSADIMAAAPRAAAAARQWIIPSRNGRAPRRVMDGGGPDRLSRLFAYQLILRREFVLTRALIWDWNGAAPGPANQSFIVSMESLMPRELAMRGIAGACARLERGSLCVVGLCVCVRFGREFGAESAGCRLRLGCTDFEPENRFYSMAQK